MKFDPKDPCVRIKLLQEKILRQRSALKSQRIEILELQARLRKPEVRIAAAVPNAEAVEELLATEEISNRTYNSLFKWPSSPNPESIQALAGFQQQELMRLKNFGIASLRDVANALRKRGLWFKPGGVQYLRRDSLPSSTKSTTIKPDVQEAVSGD